MKKQRRKFTKEFKLQVILEALKERSTLKELSQKYELQSTQITTWTQIHRGFSQQAKRKNETTSISSNLKSLKNLFSMEIL